MNEQVNTTGTKPNENPTSNPTGKELTQGLGPIDFAADAGVGMKDISREDIKIPMIYLIQRNTPVAIPSSPEYIEGSVEGMFMNSVTRDLYDGDKGIVVVPALYKRFFVEWEPKENGTNKIFVRTHLPESNIIKETTKNEKNHYILPNDNEIIDTAYHYVILVDKKEGQHSPALITMSRTSLKASKSWNSQMILINIALPNKKMITPPCFGTKWRMTSISQQKNKLSWMIWNAEYIGLNQDQILYTMAKSFRQSIEDGIAKPVESESYNSEDTIVNSPTGESQSADKFPEDAF